MPRKGIAPLSFETNIYIQKIPSPTSSTGHTRFMNLPEIFSVAEAREFGIMAANCFTPEMMRALVRAASDTGSPLIVEVAESQIDYALTGRGYRQKLERYMSSLVGTVADIGKEAGRVVPVCAHIDHLQKDPQLACAAMQAGFTSVELDFSKQDTDDRMEAVRLNAEKCNKVIPDLHANGVSVEAEEGEIGSTSARGKQSVDEIRAEATKPEYAVELIRLTNADALAMFIGSAHGEVEGELPIFYEIIGDCRRAQRIAGVDVPAVLHGGTGQTHEGFRTAVHFGARKFNYASRWWTILQKNIASDSDGAIILQEMEQTAREKKGKSARYVFGEFSDRLYKEVNDEVFERAEWEMYRHAVELMSNAFGSAGQARFYQTDLD